MPEKPPDTRLAGISVGAVLLIVVGILAWGTLTSAPGEPGAPPPLEPTSAPPDARLFPEVFSVTDAVAHDRVWFVLDARGNQVHRISPVEGLLGSFGREGSGPGEFRNPAAIAAHGDSIVVIEGGMLHLFDERGTHIRDRDFGLGLVEESCLVLPGSIADAVSVQAGLLLLVRCLNLQDESIPITVHAAIEMGDGLIRSIAQRSGEPPVIGLPIMAPIVAAHPRGFLLGSAFDTCLDLIDLSGRELDTVCHDGLERIPFPRHLAREALADAITAAREVGLSLGIPDEVSPVVGVSVANGDRLVYRVLLPGRFEAAMFGLVALDETGVVLALDAPQAPGLFVDGTSVMASWEEMEGTRIAFRTLGGL